MNARNDLENLLIRMRQRLYPETTPVLASYWLKTVCRVEHKRGWWQELNGLLKEAVHEETLNVPSREALMGIREWMVRAEVLTKQSPATASPLLEPYRANPPRDCLGPYLARLLNEWLPAEAARLLIEDTEVDIPRDGPPVLAIGRALERLLVRERLLPETLESLLQQELLSPEYIYAADAELLRDVALALLGRTEAPAFPVLPAMVLAVPETSPLPKNLSELVSQASFINEKIHVPISEAQARQILQGAPMHIASILVTTDGRWWETEKLQSADNHSIVYRPGGRLRVDRSAEHARFSAPWPERWVRWSGAVHLPNALELFGREWHASSWEQDGEHAWLNLEFSRVLPMAEIQPEAEEGLRRSRPAFVDMAWSALENALAVAFEEQSGEAIEHLRRTEFIPLGRALQGLAELLDRHWPPKRDTVLTQLRAIRYLEAEIAVDYGRVPWKVLPAPLQNGLLKRRHYPEMPELLGEVFDGLPESVNTAIQRATPSRAA